MHASLAIESAHDFRSCTLKHPTFSSNLTPQAAQDLEAIKSLSTHSSVAVDTGAVYTGDCESRAHLGAMLYAVPPMQELWVLF